MASIEKSIASSTDAFDKVVNLALRRGLVFPTSDAYGSFAGFFDYANYGLTLRKRLEAAWWNWFVEKREDVVGLDGAIIAHPTVWKASGHADTFGDLIVECTSCHARHRADQLLESVAGVNAEGLPADHVTTLMAEHKVVCPNCKGKLGAASSFNLMFATQVGPVPDEKMKAYLRPETAQSIFAAFKAVSAVSRKTLPFGIAQIGKAFRNEISPRNFLFRMREFTQMELEFFLHPAKLDEAPLTNAELSLETAFLTEEIQHANAKLDVAGGAGNAKHKPAARMTFAAALEKGLFKSRWHAYWLAQALLFYQSVGVKPEHLRVRQHVKDELSHYSSETWDVEYDFPGFGFKEVVGLANRGSFDLTQHSKFSGKDLSVFDEATKSKVVPAVIEPSFGLDRLFLAVLCDAYHEQNEPNGVDAKGKPKFETKITLSLAPAVSPVHVGVFPLMKKDGLYEKARDVFTALNQAGLRAEFDESGSIGKRYARHDEIGTPICITVDYETIGRPQKAEDKKLEGTVTVRERDSAAQHRVAIQDLPGWLTQRL